MSLPDAPAVPRLILPIQYLRGIAALMVVWYHSVGQTPSIAALFPSSFGNSGVDLFFVISGFIMVVTTASSKLTAMEFFRRRVVRVVPLYWLLTLAMVGVAVVAPALFKTLVVAPVTLVESLLFIPHFSHSFPTKAWPLLVPGWTLNFEMFFYLVFALSLLLPSRARLPALAATFALLVGIGFALGPFNSAAAQVYTNPIMLEFVGGALLGKWWLSRRLLAPRWLSIAAIALGSLLLAFRGQDPFGFFNQMIGAVLVVFGALYVSFSAWLNRPLKALGDSSYSLYLTHLFTLGALRVIWSRAFAGETTVPEACTFIGLGLVASSFVGYVTYRWIETPLLARLQHVGRPRTAGAVRAT
jgi:exopolysaccharide production protein ExoZ